MRRCSGRLALWPLLASGLVVFGGSIPFGLAGGAPAPRAWGAALGFPVGMSAAADDPPSRHRVSVACSIGYGAFLAGPPFLGALGDRVGTLDSLLAVALLMVPAALTVLLAPDACGGSAPLSSATRTSASWRGGPAALQ